VQYIISKLVSKRGNVEITKLMPDWHRVVFVKKISFYRAFERVQ